MATVSDLGSIPLQSQKHGGLLDCHAWTPHPLPSKSSGGRMQCIVSQSRGSRPASRNHASCSNLEDASASAMAAAAAAGSQLAQECAADAQSAEKRRSSRRSMQ